MHSLMNRFARVMHQKKGAIHNLKKFFASRRMKYTLPVYKDLPVNILLSKKENITRNQKKPPGMTGRKGKFYICGFAIRCYWLPWFWEAFPVFVQVLEGKPVSEPVGHYCG